MKKIIINGQMRNKPILIVIYRSSLVKAAMNAALVCKLRNGVKKTPHFLETLRTPDLCYCTRHISYLYVTPVHYQTPFLSVLLTSISG